MSYRPLATRYIKTYYKNHHFKTWNLKWFKWMICELRNILKKQEHVHRFACACWDSYQATTCQKSNSDTIEVFQFGSKNPCPHFETFDLTVLKSLCFNFQAWKNEFRRKFSVWACQESQCWTTAYRQPRTQLGTKMMQPLSYTEYLRCFPINLKEEHLRTFTFMHP